VATPSLVVATSASPTAAALAADGRPTAGFPATGLPVTGLPAAGLSTARDSVLEDPQDDAQREARELRDRCVEGLRVRRDRTALDDCRIFGQRFPGHPAARALAFGAGGLAEELGALSSAADAYTRAFLLSPLVGATGDDALLARARVHAALGNVDEARADLRIYLHRAPQTKDSPEVVRLVRILGLAP
jgi:tetratricopeptide (TPR) repeat protein